MTLFGQGRFFEEPSRLAALGLFQCIDRSPKNCRFLPLFLVVIFTHFEK